MRAPFRREVPRRVADRWRVVGFAFLTAFVTSTIYGVIRYPVHRRHGHSATMSDVAKATAMKYAYEAFPSWVVSHPDRPCPVCLHELNEYMPNTTIQDPWGREYRMHCSPSGGVVVHSLGEDGLGNTNDDIWSR